MRIDTDTANDRQMAQVLAEGLQWLTDKGREGAKVMQEFWSEDFAEANAWLTDLEDGKEL